MNTTNILNHFSALEDPRQCWKVLYPLPEILLVVLCGVMNAFATVEIGLARRTNV